ncbi:MAG: Uncharacterized protein G01um10143_354 [Parcubacteria group bacterium Gr01-1014_3]|nr:MAG: Uncharacterized protein G01um10143_354 [Parcubacteria group bacterium Gr01-1014_3]
MNGHAIVIGVTGEIGAGKETFSRLLIDEMFNQQLHPSRRTMVFSDILKKICDAANILPSRENLQKMPVILKEAFPGWTLAAAMAKFVEENLAEVKIVDGVRWPEDGTMIRGFVRNLLVYVTAPPDTRYQRVKARNQKPGEADLTWEQFCENEMKPTEINISTIGAGADFKIDNSGNLDDYRRQVKEFVDQKLRPMLEHKEEAQA